MVADPGYPKIGWEINGVIVHAPTAFGEGVSWLLNFEAALPDKAKKMRAYSKEQGWNEMVHRSMWASVLLDHWLDKHAVRID